MAKPFHLQPLLGLAEERSQAAAQALARLKQAWQEAETKSQQLQGYLEEYHGKLQQQTQSGLSIAQLRDYQAFIAKLELAIRTQGEEAQRCKQRWEAGRQEWMIRERELKAYMTLRQRHAEAERKEEDRTDQRVQDEIARNQHYRKQHPDG